MPVTIGRQQVAAESDARGKRLLDAAKTRTVADVLRGHGIPARTRRDGSTTFTLGGMVLVVPGGFRVNVLAGLAADEEMALLAPESDSQPHGGDVRALAQEQRDRATLKTPRKLVSIGDEVPELMPGYVGGLTNDATRKHRDEVMARETPDV